MSCGNKCYGVYSPGATVTLTAKANSGSAFSGWSGACSGNASTCTVALNAESAVTATPPAGKTFASWGGACSGTELTCSLNMIGDTSVQANFNK